MPPPARVNLAVAEVWTGTAGVTLAAPATAHTAGNTLVVCAGQSTSGIPISGITDTAGNSYTKVDHALPTDNSYREEIWYAKNIAGHAANVVTVSWSPSAPTFRAVTVVQYAGLSPSAPFDATAKSSSNTNPVTTGTLTTTDSNEIHLLLTRWGWGVAVTFPAGFTMLPGLGTHMEIAEALVAAPMSGTYAINHAGAGSRIAFAAAFKPTPAAGGGASAQPFVILPV